MRDMRRNIMPRLALWKCPQRCTGVAGHGSAIRNTINDKFLRISFLPGSSLSIKKGLVWNMRSTKIKKAAYVYAASAIVNQW
jgi:hypothetical protein